MLSPGSGNTVIKSKLISRRMFLITAAKAIVMVGLVGRLIYLQINQATKYKSLSDKNRFVFSCLVNLERDKSSY